MRRACALALLALAACSSARGGNPGSSSGGNGATSSGTTSGGTTGTGTGGNGPYEPFDGGPHHIRFPDAVAADAGCTIEDPVLDDAGQCVQCASDTDCPAPLVCELGLANDTRGLCGQCSQAEQICPAGQFCDITDQCLPDCTVGSPCLTPLGGYCSEPLGCQLGCRDAADCPTENPICDSATGLCGPCTEGSPGSAGGCPAGQICGYRYQYVPGSPSPQVPACLPDCRATAGSCRPGVCGDAGSCLAGDCRSDADCAGSNIPDCSGGHCQQCLTDSECLALGIGAPICAGGECSALCSGDSGACGAERCAVIVRSGFPVDECACTADSDCAGQALAPNCIPMPPAAVVDADAGLFGSCGCVSGGCAAGMVCEGRAFLLPSGAPSAACIPNCAGGKVDCASQNLNCDPATGYCVPCSQDDQCDADAGQAVCVSPSAPNPLGGGTCGCTPSACSSGEVCDVALGTCHPACVYTADGFDSCLDEGSRSPALCNSETGLCQQCFQAVDCIGRSWSAVEGVSYPFPFCSDAGQCIACNTYRDCPAGFPGCSGGVCGACATTADCAPGFGCSPWGTCLTSCDGGNCDPDGGRPLCAANVCVQCITSADCASVGFGFFCVDGTCEPGS